MLAKANGHALRLSPMLQNAAAFQRLESRIADVDLDRIGAVPWRSVSSGQSESDRSAALIAMLDSMGPKIPTARHLSILEQPNDEFFSFSKERSGHP